MLLRATRRRILTLLLHSGPRWVGLLSQSGDSVKEINGQGYRRQPASFAPIDDLDASRTGVDVEFGPALEAWQAASFIGVFDEESGGEPMIAVEIIGVPRELTPGDRWKFSKGDIEVGY